LKKRTKKLCQIQAEPLRKGRSQLSKSLLLLFFKKEGLPAACLPARLGTELLLRKGDQMTAPWHAAGKLSIGRDPRLLFA
jgi:hypothetical protein